MTKRASDSMVIHEIPKFVKLLESKKPAKKDIIDEVFNVSVERGLNGDECSLLLHLFCKGSMSMNDKLQLLKNIVPEKQIPADAMRQFMAWFVSSFRTEDTFGSRPGARILQWIIGLLEHNLVDPKEIDNFYLDFFDMLQPPLIPYVAKLLCKLTKPDDVTSQTVLTFLDYMDENNKYLLAVLNVFKGYKPHLMPEEVKDVNVMNVLKSVHQSMDSVMKVRAITTRAIQMPSKLFTVRDIPTKNFLCFQEDQNKISSLIPLPTYNLEGTDKFKACYVNSIEQAGRKFSRVPIPENILSLMYNDVGFFMIAYQRIELQMRFQHNLLQKLQDALIYQELKTCDDDVEFLLRKVYQLETFMQQGIHGVSVFLSGYLLNWNGLDHQSSILKLIEWATFHSFRELACNILRPLHILFVSNNANLKKKIIRTVTNLTRNMFADVSRVQQAVVFPFLKRGPKWVKDPESMLCSLITWTQNLITLGLAVEQDPSSLLMESIRFYKMVNMLEKASGLPMFTIVSEGVVLQSLVGQNPNTIISICRLLLRYQKEFLPRLRVQQPQFYEHCQEKIGLLSNYALTLVNFLQNGQVVFSKSKNGAVNRDFPNASLMEGIDPLRLDSHMCFVTTYVLFETKKNFLNLAHPEDRMKSLQLASFHLREIQEFINFFSPSVPEAR